MKKYCFDLDGVICNNTYGNYQQAKPNLSAIAKINKLHEKSNYIIIFTARFMGRNNNNIDKAYEQGYEFTKSQLLEWNVKYNDLILGKPEFDILKDDKSFDYSDSWITKDTL